MEMKMHEHHHDEPVEDIEIKSWKKKMIGSWIFAIPIAFLMISERIFGFSFNSSIPRLFFVEIRMKLYFFDWNLA